VNVERLLNGDIVCVVWWQSSTMSLKIQSVETEQSEVIQTAPDSAAAQVPLKH